MRKLLKPWLEEGSVVLYELEYDGKSLLHFEPRPMS